jgi:hypothetical protein
MVFLLLLGQVHAKELNIYLKFDEPPLTQAISEFNNYLKIQGIFDKYQIQPFLGNHPLHITLYLAAFHDEQLPLIKEHVSKIAALWAPISIKTTQLYLTGGNYVMLDLDNKQIKGINQPMQQLSDAMTLELNLFRDTEAKIPDWAQSVPGKRKAFERYGSPNVFFEYSPHFTLMAKIFSDPLQERAFQQELTGLIESYPFPEITTKSVAIGIGYVNNFGQIVEELAAYPLEK